MKVTVKRIMSPPNAQKICELCREPLLGNHVGAHAWAAQEPN
jgi:hypothetical protein